MEGKVRRIRELSELLSNKHLKFANHVLDGMTQDEAYLAVPYKCSKVGAQANACRLIARDDVSEYIKLNKEVASGKAAETLEITQERIMQELAKMGFSNMKNYVNDQGIIKSVNDLSEFEAAAIVDLRQRVIKTTIDNDERTELVETQLKLADKKGSLELLGKSEGIQMFTDKVKINEGNPLAFILDRISEESEDSSPLPSGL